jgi:peptide-methionine (R)-S-oxide reductase
MRFASFTSLAKSIYIFTSATTRTFPAVLHRATHPLRPQLLKSYMPIPFLGSLFSSSSSKNMSYPVQKSDQEWQAVLSPGKLPVLSSFAKKVANQEQRAIPRSPRKRH